MQKLTAQTSILFESKIYAPGEELPASNPDMVEAWLAAGTAAWVDTEQQPQTPKARSKTAEPGLPGKAAASEAEDSNDLVGKVPKTVRRKKN